MAPNSKLNHVAMSVSAQVLDAVTRAKIVAFYSAVFGWSEQLFDEPGNPLVIFVGVEPTQFVFVQPDVTNQCGRATWITSVSKWAARRPWTRS